jgi:uncharacterized protein YkwD
LRRCLAVALAAGLAALWSLRAAAAPARYGDALPPAPRSALVARAETLVRQIAAGAARPVPEVEPRLERAAAEIARRVPASTPPSNELVESALWLAGIVEPPPHLIVVTLGPGAADDDGALQSELRSQVPRVLADAVYRRFGVAAEPLGNEMRVVVALQESYVDLEPIARTLPPGGSAPLRGRLRAPYQHPEVFVTAPDGQVTRLPLGGDPARFEAALRCGAVGRHQVEVTGEDRFGPTVVANFPIYCGMAAPERVGDERTPRPGGDDAPADSAARAEAAIVRLVQADRARAGLPPLQVEPRLSAIARAHSDDMLRHNFVGHVSPTTGTTADRVRAAGVDTQLLLENVARAYSPGEAERGLMESPGHRANLLNREVTELGVGVVLGAAQGAAHELLVTQLFARPLDAITARAPDELRRRVDDFRRERALPLFGADAALDQIAESAARDLARGVLTAADASGPVERALAPLADRYRTARTVVAVTGGLQQVIDAVQAALVDKSATTCGIGLASGRRADHSAAIFAVLVLATRR